MLTTIEDSCTSGILSSSLCFHISPYSDGLLNSLGGDFTRLPEGNYTGLRSFDSFYSNPELEQIAVVTFSGCKALKAAGGSLGQLLGLYPVVGLLCVCIYGNTNVFENIFYFHCNLCEFVLFDTFKKKHCLTEPTPVSDLL